MKTKVKKVRFQPEPGRLLGRPIAVEDKTAGGIYKPEVSREAPQEVIVIATHPSNRHKVGDKLLCARYAGYSVEIDNEKGLLILSEDPSENHILGQLVGGPNA